MTTPRKDFSYNLPYATPVQKYPSQSEDFISMDMGGPKQNPVTASNEKTPGQYNARYYHQQNYRNSDSKANRRNLFNNSAYDQQNPRRSFNQQRFGSRKSGEWSQQSNIRNSNEKRPQQHKKYDKKDTNSVASYIHPSMTEDPWFELTQRLRSLEQSKISLKETSPSPEKSSNSDANQETDHVTSD